MKLIAMFAILGMSVFSASSVYDFKINSLDGKLIDLAQYKGKTLLIVNTASACGYTPQYADLQKLHETYGSKVVVLGFPGQQLWRTGAGHKLRDRGVLPEELWCYVPAV
jgi:glutathione peroxidase